MSGLLLGGRLKQSGVTFYTRNGKMVARTATSVQPKRRTRAQFIARQRLVHSSHLWGMLKRVCTPLINGGQNAYGRFRTLMAQMPAVYFPDNGQAGVSTVLLPELPVSEGVLPTVHQYLGEVDGTPALITDLRPAMLRGADGLVLVELTQAVENGCPMVRPQKRDVAVGSMVHTSEGLALKDNAFADNMKGWALVRVNGDRSSTQTIVTNCTYYCQFTTEDALQAAAESYGGLTKEVR